MICLNRKIYSWSADCHNCTILKQGTDLQVFWGDHPEVGDILTGFENYLLAMESRRGKGLVVYQPFAPRLPSGDELITGGRIRIEFFSKYSTSKW